MYTRRQFAARSGVVLLGFSGCSGLTGVSGGAEENEDSKRLLVASDGSKEDVLLRYEHVARVIDVLDADENNGTDAVGVELTDEGEDSFYDGLEELGAADDPDEIELYTYLDGEVVFTTGITAALAERPDPEADSSMFRILAPDRETAEELEEALENA